MMNVDSLPLIEVRGLSKTYAASGSAKVQALSNIDLTVARGEVVALLGPSGCGKSTLLSIIAGLESPSMGAAYVGGEPAKPQASVGVMFQKPALFPWRTVLANVLLPAHLLGLPISRTTARAQELLATVGLSGWEHRYPWELSGGMQQRVALARVLLTDPDLVLLDEPFGALDEISREALNLELMNVTAAQGKTVVLVTHNVYEAALLAHRIVVMTSRPGRIAGIVPVDMAQPRDLAFAESEIFGHAVTEARALLRAEQTQNPPLSRGLAVR